MLEAAKANWKRVIEDVWAANAIQGIDLDGTATVSFFAAFHAVSSYLDLHGRTFKTHRSVFAALYTDLVHTGLVPAEVGKSYRRLIELWMIGTHGGCRRISCEEAEEAKTLSTLIVREIHKLDPDLFTLPP